MNNQQYMHVHRYEGNTTCADGHSHGFAGVSGPAMHFPDGRHIHVVQGLTDFKDGHYHRYCVRSGPNIDLPGGFHVHPVCFRTSVDDGHTHDFRGYDMASMEEKHKGY